MQRFSQIQWPDWLRYVQWIVAIALIVVLYRHIRGMTEQIGYASIAQSLQKPIWLLGLPILLGLMTVNWLLEAYKWRAALSFSLAPSIALDSIIAGVTLGFITPARAGEYAGRLAYIQPAHRPAALMATAICSLVQNGLHIYLALWALLIHPISGFEQRPHARVVLLALGLAGLLFYMYFQTLFPSTRWNRLARWIDPLSALSSIDKLQIIGYALMRYGVYILQYLLILWWLDVPWMGLHSITATALIFGIQTGIPLPPSIAFATRGHIALWAWSFLASHELNILTAAYLIWFINLAIPALYGYYRWWRHRSVRSGL